MVRFNIFARKLKSIVVQIFFWQRSFWAFKSQNFGKPYKLIIKIQAILVPFVVSFVVVFDFLHSLVSSFKTIMVLFCCQKYWSLAKKLSVFWSLGVCWNFWSLCVGQMGVTRQKLIVSSSDSSVCNIFQLGHFPFLTLFIPDTFRQNYAILTLSKSDAFRFWHFPIMTLSNSVNFWFWHFKII